MNLKNIILGIAITILTIFVTIYGINTFYAKQKYNDFCGGSKPIGIINNQETCGKVGGKWTDYTFNLKKENINGELMKGNCDRDYTCRKKYESAMETYSKIVFLIAVPLGIIILGLGAFLFSLESVGVGLMGGGIGTLIYGIGNYWSYAGNWLRFLISLIGLVALIFLAYWFNNKNWNILNSKKESKEKRKRK